MYTPARLSESTGTDTNTSSMLSHYGICWGLVITKAARVNLSDTVPPLHGRWRSMIGTSGRPWNAVACIPFTITHLSIYPTFFPGDSLRLFTPSHNLGLGFKVSTGNKDGGVRIWSPMLRWMGGRHLTEEGEELVIFSFLLTLVGALSLHLSYLGAFCVNFFLRLHGLGAFTFVNSFFFHPDFTLSSCHPPNQKGQRLDYSSLAQRYNIACVFVCTIRSGGV
ncbi:hypothetical protein BX600DRAFT_99352 [Xylariales sp. PMI_506]|nr:hypothetical protein BX600DRAFT_99352 [Xylariales sp. PMI_506]